MVPSPGQSLLQYRLVEQIGAGGMGVVWRATDSALGRDAAIKILPDVFSGDPERLVRFEREAKLLASLSHPNIASVYGLHVSDGVRFLAMEMVKGEDLAARVARGPIPVDEALGLARQIADALETAHENGVIHRDLKPANVRLTAEGTAKVLDFGLAKAFDAFSASGRDQQGLSPTVTSAGSVMGMILGTAAYMSPEQARGKPVDRRTDIWSFGCVVYEMLTGKRPFDGETVSDSIAKILQTDADLSKLPARTPRAVRELIARCLEKDPKRRLRDIGDARLVLEDVARAGIGSTADEGPAARRSTRSGWLPWAVAGAAVAAAVALFAVAPRGGTAANATRGAKFLALNAPGGMRFTDQPGDIVVAPDGRSIVVVAPAGEDTPRLYLRRFDDPAWRALPGTEGAYFPFWSGDGRLVGFFASNKLKKIAIGGGTAETICDAAAGRGGTWNQDGLILFAPGPSGPLMQVKAEGGAVTPATELDAAMGEVGHRFPRFLPDGRHFMYASVPVHDGGHDTWLASLGSKERKLVVNSDGVPSFAAPDRLVYRRNKTLYVQPFDPGVGHVVGEARALVEAGLTEGFMASPTSSAAGGGVLAFIPLLDSSTELVSFSLDGVQGDTLPLAAGQYNEVRFSPDGTRVATARFERDNPLTAGSDIWLVDLARKNGSRVTFDPQFEFSPVWSPDGKTIFFNGNKTGAYLIYRLSAEGAGEAVAISKARGLSQSPDDITPDGRQLVFESQEPQTGFDLWILDTAGGKPPIAYLNSAYNDSDARLSPDGRWIAYISNENGRDEVYVQSFPTPGSKVQVSSGGSNVAPVWRRDGKRLFFVATGGTMMAADVTPGSALRVAAPVKLFRLPRPCRFFDVAPDGKTILASMSASDAAGRTIGVILDWDAASK
jgi:tRNA A-37 threonylcarbamoyl transferase component Bud32/dipeptidyl aminopeptidase/acylaminoacyl peptidase